MAKDASEQVADFLLEFLPNLLPPGKRNSIFAVKYLYQQDSINYTYDSVTDYLLTNALGSTRQLVNANNQITLAESYDPFGNIINSIGSDSSIFGFTGQQTDSYSGLQYLRARYYDSSIATFTTRDTWSGDANNPLSFNRWVYTNDNPVNLADPSGHCVNSDGSVIWWEWPFFNWGPCPSNNNPPAPTPSPLPSPTIPPTATCTPTVIPTPTGVTVNDVLITHYIMPIENDPFFASSYLVTIPIAAYPGGPVDYYTHQHNDAFVYGKWDANIGAMVGVYQEGTGIPNGHPYITQDHSQVTNNGKDKGRAVFVYQEGGSCGIHQVDWQTVAAHNKALFHCGTKVAIDAYPGKIFTVTDTGSNVGSNQLDIFVGAMNVANFNSEFSQPGSTHFKTNITIIQ